VSLIYADAACFQRVTCSTVDPTDKNPHHARLLGIFNAVSIISYLSSRLRFPRKKEREIKRRFSITFRVFFFLIQTTMKALFN
jgi:hypothetical protein